MAVDHLKCCRDSCSALVDDEGKRSFLDPYSHNTFTVDRDANNMACNTSRFQRRFDGRRIKKHLRLECPQGPHEIHNHRGLNDREIQRARLEYRSRIQMACNRDWRKDRDVYEREYARTPITGWDKQWTYVQMELAMYESSQDGRIYTDGAKLGYSEEEHRVRRCARQLVKRAKRCVPSMPAAPSDDRSDGGSGPPAA